MGDPGGAISCPVDQCPTGRGAGYLCKGDIHCGSKWSRWMKVCGHAINADGSWSPTFKDGTYGHNYINFWCNEKGGFHDIVGSLMDCVGKRAPMNFVITTCNLHESLQEYNATVFV